MTETFYMMCTLSLMLVHAPLDNMEEEGLFLLFKKSKWANVFISICLLHMFYKTCLEDRNWAKK